MSEADANSSATVKLTLDKAQKKFLKYIIMNDDGGRFYNNLSQGISSNQHNEKVWAEITQRFNEGTGLNASRQKL